MFYLLIASFIWAFSFGLIKGKLTDLDPSLVSFLRIFISFIIFIPVFKFKKINNPKLLIHLLVIGSIQFGLMYISYIYSFRYLKAYEVALFTILTPIYVTIINDLFNKRLDYMSLISAIVAIMGAWVIVYSRFEYMDFITGALMVQVSNICFAVGQIYYKKVMSKYPLIQSSDIFAVMYFGALITTGLFTLTSVKWSSVSINSSQLMSLLYLGVVASGLGFYLWNVGILRSKISTLAVMNNAKIPLAVLCSIFVFSEHADWLRLIIGGSIMIISVVISEKYSYPKYLG
ncbi:MAG: EamA family transporter [Proteobacteria bacterium]|nr:EamA family transporter [Pseudomonadota bacterium]